MSADTKSGRTPIEALQYLEEKLSSHPVCNEEIVHDIMNGDYSSTEDAGGDEADISEWCAVCRLALNAEKQQPGRA